MKRRIDLQTLIGCQFDRLTIICAKRNAQGHIIAEACCLCGNKWQGLFSSLKKGYTRSCGCLNAEFKKRTFNLRIRKQVGKELNWQK